MKQIATLAVLVLSACATVPDAKNDPYPVNYKDIVKEHVRETFFDPDSVKDVEISKPEWGAPYGMTDGYLVCMRANGKNQFGGYTGAHEFAFVVKAGQVVQSNERTASAWCTNARYL